MKIQMMIQKMMKVSMKIKSNLIKFHEDYTEKDWRNDWPLIDSMIEFVPLAERETLKDSIIATINNKTHTVEERNKIIESLFAPYVNLDSFAKMSKFKLIKLGVRMKVHQLRSRGGKKR